MMPGAMRMSGVVVDGRGTPVAGATVAVGIVVAGDAISIATPFYAPGGPFRMLDVVTTDAQGRYVLEYAPGCYGALVAQRGTERSDVISATEGARLVLQPTTHVRGRVDLAGRAGMFAVSVSRASDAVFVGNSTVIAMVGSDGRFSVDGVVPGKVVIGLSEGSRSISGHGSMKHLRVGPRGLDNVVLEVPAGRELRVLVRGNDIFTGPPVFVVDGAVEAKTLGELVWRAGQHQMATTAVRAISSVPPEIAGHYRPGDLFGTFPSAPTGAATACAMRSATGCSDAIRVECVPVPANAALVTIEANKPR